MKFDPLEADALDRAAGLVVWACRAVFGSSLICVILKGSAVKGDLIRGYSDLDFHVFLKPEVMDGENVPKADYAVQFQRAFGQVSPEDFEVSQFQIYFINSEKYPEDWAPPVEGTYRILWGSLPETAKELDDGAYIRFAEQHLSLSSIEYSRRSNVARFVDKPNTRIEYNVRLVGATLKNYMYSISVMLTKEPKVAFKLGLDKMIALVEEGIGSEGHFRTFFEYVSDWQRIRRQPEYAREAFKEGIQALNEIHSWRTN
jgi:predicted nucleotidyltransferase